MRFRIYVAACILKYYINLKWRNEGFLQKQPTKGVLHKDGFKNFKTDWVIPFTESVCAQYIEYLDFKQRENQSYL